MLNLAWELSCSPQYHWWWTLIVVLSILVGYLASVFLSKNNKIKESIIVKNIEPIIEKKDVLDSQHIVLPSPPEKTNYLNSIKFMLWRELINYSPYTELIKEIDESETYIQWLCRGGDAIFFIATAEFKHGRWIWDFKEIQSNDIDLLISKYC